MLPRYAISLVYACLTLALTALPHSASAQLPTPPAGIKHVFIVSFDGGKPAVMQQSKMPVVMNFLKQGAGTWDARTVFPSITLISHTSMLTGVGPEKHHITWNDWVPEKGLVPVPTIFSLAHKQKLVTALFAGKEKFAHLYLPGSLDGFAIPSYEAKTVAATAAQYIAEKKPNLCFVHFADSDGAGHSFGWGSDEQKQAFADEDAALNSLLKGIQKAGLRDSSVVILSADHGGHAKTHGSNAPDDMVIPWMANGKGVKKGLTLTKPVTTYDTAATALWLLGVPIPAEFDGKPVTEAFDTGP